MKTFVSCVAGLAFCCLFVLPPAHTQATKSRVVESAVGDGPVEIVGLSIAGRKAGVSEEVAAGRDWLKSLTLKFKNAHTRSIVYMSVELEVERTGNMQYPLRLPMTFGERPSEASASQAARPQERMAPNEKKELTLSESTYDFLLRFMQENQVDEINKVKVFAELIIFDDGTAWGKGHVLRRDPNDPKRWVVSGIW